MAESREILKIIEENYPQVKKLLNITASSVEYNSNGDYVTKSTKVEGAIKDLDKAIAHKQDKLSGTNLSIPVYTEKGIGEVPLSEFSKNTHNHADKLDKPKNVIPGNFVIVKEDGIGDSKISPKDIALKEEVNEVKESLLKISQNCQSLKNEITTKVSEKHSHDEYLKKFTGLEGNIVTFSKDGIKDSGINLKEVSQINQILIMVDGVIKSVEKIQTQIDTKAEKNHTHSINDIGLTELESIINKLLDGKVYKIISDVKSSIISSLK